MQVNTSRDCVTAVSPPEICLHFPPSCHLSRPGADKTVFPLLFSACLSVLSPCVASIPPIPPESNHLANFFTKGVPLFAHHK